MKKRPTIYFIPLQIVNLFENECLVILKIDTKIVRHSFIVSGFRRDLVEKATPRDFSAKTHKERRFFSVSPLKIVFGKVRHLRDINKSGRKYNS